MSVSNASDSELDCESDSESASDSNSESLTESMPVVDFVSGSNNEFYSDSDSDLLRVHGRFQLRLQLRLICRVSELDSKFNPTSVADSDSAFTSEFVP